MIPDIAGDGVGPEIAVSMRRIIAAAVEKAYAGIITKASVDAAGLVDIRDCSSIGIQDNYKAYIDSPKEVNPFAPVTSFILGTSAMEFRRDR